MEEFQVTTAIRKLFKLKKRKKIIQGGTSAGKTFGILPILIDRAIRTPYTEISVVSESIPHLKRGALKDFLKIMQMTNRYVDSQFARQDLKYRFTNGSYIEFFSVDQPDKLRGARRHILYINEANNINFDSYTNLAIRTSGEIWLDFNPTHKFWAHTEVAPYDDAELIVLTYKDNESLSETIVKDIEAAQFKDTTYWKNWWKVYGCGQIGSLEGACIPDWSIIDDLPRDKNGNLECRLVNYGLDFGYSNDPSTLIGIYKWNDSYIYDEVFYETNLLNIHIDKKLKENNIGNAIIYADNAEPKSIADLKRMGWKVYPCVKGSDSIVYGLNLINQKGVYVTKRSSNLQYELSNYVWKKDKEGNPENKPVDKFNHTIDAIRYGLTSDIKNPNRGKYSIF